MKILQPANTIQRFLKHRWYAVNEHGIHSPFVFKLLTESVYLKRDAEKFKRLEQIRSAMFADNRVIDVTDLGAGSTYDGAPKQRKIADIARRFAKSPKYCRLLFSIVDHLKPTTMVELGTSLGMSAMYQAIGNPNGKLHTIEGCPNTSALAQSNFEKASINNIIAYTGNFDVVLPELLSKLETIDCAYVDGNHTYDATLSYYKLLRKYVHSKTLLIFDDIHWSDGMERAWEEIKSQPDVTITIDFFAVGLVFFNPDFTKQDFNIRY